MASHDRFRCGCARDATTNSAPKQFVGRLRPNARSSSLGIRIVIGRTGLCREHRKAEEFVECQLRRRRVRYAVVGLGHIAQVAVLPAFAHATRNSQLVAVVSGDRTKRRELAKRYRLEHAFSYDEFDDCLDAGRRRLHRAARTRCTPSTPIRAARAGVHVLCEKPMAVTVDECRADDRRLPAGRRQADDRLPAALRGAEPRAPWTWRAAGASASLKFFNSSFSMTVRRGDIRTKRAYGGGTLYDIGVYCINAARNLFRAEPTQVVGRLGQQRRCATLAEIDETTAATLRFGGEQRGDVRHQLQCRRRRGLPHRRHEGAPARRPGLRVRRRPRLHADGRREDDEEAHRQARSVRAGAAVFLRLHPERIASPSPRARKGCRTCGSSRRCTSRRRSGRPVAIRPFAKRTRPTTRQRITRPGVQKAAR